MTVLPYSSKEVRLHSRPNGLPKEENFELKSVPINSGLNGEVLVKNLYTRVSASLRMMIGEGAEDVPGVPFPALHPGDVLAEETLGEVLSAPPKTGFAPRDLVLHSLGFREFSRVPADACLRIDDVLSFRGAHLSHGWTAYAALKCAADIRPGDTVFVTSAAGAIGTMAGQIARQMGAGRIIGSTSSKEKAARLVNELGYDATVSRSYGSLVEDLKKAAPEGIDVVLDAVGGEQLQAAVLAARDHARVVLIGALSGQLAGSGSGRTAPVALDSFPLLLKRIRLQGYSADDNPELRAEWNQRFESWLREGTIQLPVTLIKGIDQAPHAIAEVATGKTFGLTLIEY